jgi:uncharacterized membrane protein
MQALAGERSLPRAMGSRLGFGYGYPFYTFYAPLVYYAGALFHFIVGLDYGPATSFSFYTSLYLSGLLMYALVYVIGRREQWPRLE